MPDPISTLVSAATLVKQLYTLNKYATNAEAKLLLADLQNLLADARIEMAELKEKVLKLEQELARKSDAPKLRKTGTRYYGNNGEGPFCPVCYERDGKAITLQPTPQAMHVSGVFQCGVCKNLFEPQPPIPAIASVVAKPKAGGAWLGKRR